MYMVIYNGFKPPRAAFLQWMDAQPKILNWQATSLYPLFMVLWEGTAKELSTAIKEKAGIDLFVVVEAGAEKLGSEVEGWLPQATWDFIREAKPRPAPGQSSPGKPPEPKPA